MKRRGFLITMSMIGGAGCLSRGEDAGVRNEMETDSKHWPGIAVEVPNSSWDSDDNPISEQVILPDEAIAESYLRERIFTDDFVRTTDFDRSYLVVVMAGWFSSSESLVLDAFERTADRVHVAVESRTPMGPINDDLGMHSLAVRVTDDPKGVPETVVVEVNDEETGTGSVVRE